MHVQKGGEAEEEEKTVVGEWDKATSICYFF